MNRHLKLIHKYSTEMVSAIEIPISKEENMHYVCPGNVLYRKVSKVNTEARDAARKARQDYIRKQNLPVRDQPSGDLQVCRGLYVDFNNNLTEAKSKMLTLMRKYAPEADVQEVLRHGLRFSARKMVDFRSQTKNKTENCSRKQVIHGRKFPLIRLRRIALQEQVSSGVLRYFSDQEYDSLTMDQLTSRYIRIGQKPPAGTLSDKIEHLKLTERTRQIKLWHDHSSILNHSYVCFTISWLYDPANYFTDIEYQERYKDRKPINVQGIVENQSIFGQSGSSDVEQSSYTAVRIEDLQILSEPITADNGYIKIFDVMRVFSGDGPARQFEIGQQRGGNYPCVCGFHANDHGNVVLCYGISSLTLDERAASSQQTDPNIRQMIDSLLEITNISYSKYNTRSPKQILRLYNQSFLLAINCRNVVGVPSKMSSRKFFGSHFHSVSIHLAEVQRIFNLRSLVTEQEERCFGDLRRISENTSNRQPKTVCDNAVLRFTCQQSSKQESIYNQESIIQKLAKQIQAKPRTLIPSTILNKRPILIQSHLERISDYILPGEGVWWHMEDGNMIFHDGPDDEPFRNEGPDMHHFRSSSYKEQHQQLKDIWEKVIENYKGNKISLPLQRIKTFDKDSKVVYITPTETGMPTSAKLQRIQQDMPDQTNGHQLAMLR
ncbi:unnamed protein product [Mytilus edulis]|uniref:Uncharacterized protein n=1 Tax=Mytilus edulis TaxID=6550 RepID=A0A8S3PME5_MYTED|nr:unnamed protein product [Mytilus edulis]